MLEMEWLTKADYLVIVVYMIINLVVGMVVIRFNKDADDYFKSGNKLPFWLGGLSLFMASFSAWTFTGGTGKTYESGISIFSMYWGAVLGLGFGYFIFAKRWRRTRSLTILEYLSERYDSRVHQFISWANTPITLFQCGIWLYALSIFFSSASRIPIYYVILGCGGVVLLYTMLGGLWGVCITDSVQFFVLLPIAVLVLALSLIQVGGVGELISQAPPHFWTPFNETAGITKLFVILQFVNGFFMFNSGGGAQRYFSAINEREAAKIAGFGAILCFIGPFIWLTPAMVCRVLYPGLGENMVLAQSYGLAEGSEAAYVFICMKLLPPGLQGVLIAGIFAATMSSMSAFFNMYSAVITKDIIGTVFIKDASNKRLHNIGILVTFLMGVMTILIALFYNMMLQIGVFSLMFKVGAVLGIPVAVPIILGLVYRRTPTWVPYVVIVVGMLVGGVIAFGDWERYLGYEFFQGVLYPLLCVIYVVPGMLFDERHGGSARFRKWARAVLYLFGLYIIGYEIFLYYNLPQTGDLVWIQRVVKGFYSNWWNIAFFAAGWIAMTEWISRIRIMPHGRYLKEVQDFFYKLETPVDVRKEVGEDVAQQEADLSSFKLLGIVMFAISALMAFFFLIDMSSHDQLVTLIALVANLLLGLGLYLLGSRSIRRSKPETAIG